jgi:hypothetical protein
MLGSSEVVTRGKAYLEKEENENNKYLEKKKRK